MRAILLNGPPRCGKDTIARAIGPQLGLRQLKFADPIVAFMIANFGIWPDDHDKSVCMPQLHGRSIREVMIAYSEKFMKPLFGQDVFGRLAYGAMQQDSIFSDSGFATEAAVLVEKLGAENVLRVEIHRAGCSFEGDSRSYWTLPGVTTITYYNAEGHPAEAARTGLAPLVQAWLNRSA